VRFNLGNLSEKLAIWEAFLTPIPPDLKFTYNFSRDIKSAI